MATVFVCFEYTSTGEEQQLVADLMEKDHALVYTIPGKQGLVKPGDRFINFLWYTNENSHSMDEIMIDKNGHRHQYIVSAGTVRPEIWERVLARDHLLSVPHRGVLRKIKRPFVQSITDFVTPRAAFEGGRILLVGDALSLYRPHTASSTNQAAFNCLMLERFVKGEIEIEQWEREVLQFANLHCVRSIWYGENYQHKLWGALPYAFQYWGAVLTDCWRVIWSWKPSKLRW